MASKIIPVIMCGGAGTRLWPASRENMPKQFIPLLSQYSTFQDTIARVRRDDIFEKPIVITNSNFRFLVADQLNGIGASADIVLEPARRDSAPAVAVASLLGLKRDKSSLLLVLAADHVVNDVKGFHESCVSSRAAAEQGLIVTFGVMPTEPSPAYGYLNPGGEIDEGGVRKLLSFAEKPDRDKARAYIEQGYLWNSGNFLFRADVMLDELVRFQPELHQAATRAVGAATTDADFIRLGEAEFTDAPRISIDYAVMERTDKSAVLPVNFGWSDLGSWDSVWAHLRQDENGNALAGPCETIGTSNSIVQSDSILTVVLGLTDVAVVASPDAVLVAPRSVGNDLKAAVERLKSQGRKQVEDQRRVHHGWGHIERVDASELGQLARLSVAPGRQLSFENEPRLRHWFVVSGTARVSMGQEQRLLSARDSISIPAGAAGALDNTGEGPLELIEIGLPG